MSNRRPNIQPGAGEPEAEGPWDAALTQLRAWDPAFATACAKMTTNPWNTGILPRKFIELVSIGVNAACTNLNRTARAGISVRLSKPARLARRSYSF